MTGGKIAILHDHFRVVGGAEKLVLALARALRCDIITAEVNRAVLEKTGYEDIRVIPLGKTPKLPFLLPHIWKKRFSECDVRAQYDFFILSGLYAMYAAERHKPNLWYCHTPATWIYERKLQKEGPMAEEMCASDAKLEGAVSGSIAFHLNRDTIYTRIVRMKNRLIKRQIFPAAFSDAASYVFNFLPRAVSITAATARHHAVTRFANIGRAYRDTRRQAAVFSGRNGSAGQAPLFHFLAYCAKFGSYFFYIPAAHIKFKKHAVTRESDKNAATHINAITVNSRNIQNKVRKYYGRSSAIVYPPVQCADFSYRKNGFFWLSVNRLLPQKRIEMQAEAFRRLHGERLIIVGECDEYYAWYTKILDEMPRNVTYAAGVGKEELASLYAACRGFITTARDEDFGMTAVEAMAAGKPVIAPAEGGYRETVIDGATGKLIEDIDAERLAAAVREVGRNPEKFRKACRAQAERFDTQTFVKRMKQEIQKTRQRYET